TFPSLTSCPPAHVSQTMPTILYFAGIGCLALALILSFLVSISSPTIDGLGLFQAELASGNKVNLGIWGWCSFVPGEKKPACNHLGAGYRFSLDSNNVHIVHATPGLAIHPFVTVLIALALALASLKHRKGPMLATFGSFFAAFWAAIAFIIDIAFFADMKQKFSELLKTQDGHAEPGP
ncbi:hypothetical protein DFH06DRAFT_1259653, partial [Mycena polygramma]